MDSFSNRLKEALRIKGMKQTDLARKTGIDKSLISNYASGNYKAKQTNLYLIAKALDVSEAWLMGYDVDMNRTPDDERMFGIDHSEPTQTSHSPPLEMNLTPHERSVISAYRRNPDMQSAVDRLLGVDKDIGNIEQDMIETIRSTASIKKVTNTD